MRRIIELLLETGLGLSTVVALIYLVRMMLGSFYSIGWFWGGAIAALSGPPMFALAIRAYGRPFGAKSGNADA